MAETGRRERRADWWVGVVVVAVAAVLTGLSARPYAGCWNDGSRLATVECLVDEHTLAIDHSVFVLVPRPPHPAPYPADEPGLRQHGTLDKLFIAGHFYSDKSPVPAVLLAGCYRVWQWGTGWTARTHPEEFCRAMTLASSGLAYVLGVFAVYRLGGLLRLGLGLSVALTASFCLATVALPYSRHVNNHILLLGVSSWMAVGVAGLTEGETATSPWGRLLALGTLAGLGYTIDLGVGPVMLLAAGLLVAGRCRRFGPGLAFASAALPWLVLHHALNYAVGGSWKPANALPENFRWPGSPFHAGNLTGAWPHQGLVSFLLYAGSMLFGKRGFLGHNLPLFLLLPAAGVLVRQRRRERPGVLWALACCVGTWILYASTSNNSSGQCLSIRWFVPLLAPAYYLLALWLRQQPRARAPFLVLSAVGGMEVLRMGEGPWSKHMVPSFWLLQEVALVGWGCCHWLVRREESMLPPMRGYWAEVFRAWRAGARLLPSLRARGGRGRRQPEEVVPVGRVVNAEVMFEQPLRVYDALHGGASIRPGVAEGFPADQE
jgi:hypothetical protein